MDYQKIRRIPVDPKVIDIIQRSPQMRYEQGSEFMSGWGGSARYKQLARLPMESRICYAAVLEGTTDEDQLAIVTGLTSEEVSKGLADLRSRGLVQIEEP